ncbi:MAG: 4-(cytidine 5'-diphospho)-2-C-methyl-D-erythritol kinase [Erysipelotrichaceae bacterium]|nr:4-(cytidine 5'-diphospho)-2-C-methyl-D-erythritol kinase [Erysipelotrichaceae bacterium]
MKQRAYAKINLSLDIYGVRENGYHDLNSIMLPIDFYDELEIAVSEKDEYQCNRHYIRNTEENSVIKMIRILKERYSMEDHYRIVLNKQIPTQAGLGGGTADAAAALRILKAIHDLEMTDEQIRDICMQVGADVPFNYYNVPAMVGGLGEQIEAIPLKKTYYILLVKPWSGVSTKQAYELLDLDKCDHPDIPRLREALISGENIDGLLGNSLEQPAFLLNSDIVTVKEKLKAAGARNVLMSGSGSTVFCIAEDREEIRRIAQEMKDSGYYIRFTRTLNQ